ncbi:hypothetical protein C1H46_030391 [Malus baccata]|uniref:Uncharacterized protein n=1 Tax=Malus baccata TaxID=106549 RepID=A0A540LCI8_MALBA|nr:hypothetical protein C1H46_030391 [Malus baccata]
MGGWGHRWVGLEVEVGFGVGVGVSGFRLQWKSWKAISTEVKVGLLHELSSKYIHELSSWFTQWKSNFHKHYEKYKDLEVALAVGCLKELVNRPED